MSASSDWDYGEIRRALGLKEEDVLPKAVLRMHKQARLMWDRLDNGGQVMPPGVIVGLVLSAIKFPGPQLSFLPIEPKARRGKRTQEDKENGEPEAGKAEDEAPGSQGPETEEEKGDDELEMGDMPEIETHG